MKFFLTADNLESIPKEDKQLRYTTVVEPISTDEVWSQQTKKQPSSDQGPTLL